MSYSDYLTTSTPGYTPQKNAAGFLPGQGNSTGSMDNPVGDWAHDTFGKAADVPTTQADYSTTQYGGSTAASQANQANLGNQGQQGYNTDVTTGQSLYAKQSGAATGSQVTGQQANSQGQQTAQGGLNTQQQAASGIGNWLQQGAGPSVAESQLKQGNDTNVANMMAMAASGRGQGGGAAAQQAAAFQGANAGQQTNQQAATLRAQETQNYKQNQLQGLQAQAGIGSSMTSAGQNQQNLGLSYNQLAANQQQNASGDLLNSMSSGQQNNQYYSNLQQQQLANESQSATGLQTSTNQINEDAAKANQQSTYQHQSGVSGMIGAAAGALAFL